MVQGRRGCSTNTNNQQSAPQTTRHLLDSLHPPTPASCAISSRTSNLFSLLTHLQTHSYKEWRPLPDWAGPTSYVVYRCGCVVFGCLFRVHDKITGQIPDELDRPRQRPRLLGRNPPHAPGLEARGCHGWSAAAVPAVQVSAAQEVRPHPHEQPRRKKRLFPDVAGFRKG